MRWCTVQTNEYDLQGKMYPAICTDHKLHNNNENKFPVFPERICNKRQNITNISGTQPRINMITMGKGLLCFIVVCFGTLSFISSCMSETNIRPCIALWKIALYRNVALLLVPLHPVLKIIYLEIEIRAHKPRLPALIAMKDFYQFFFLIYCTFTCLQLVKIV